MNLFDAIARSVGSELSESAILPRDPRPSERSIVAASKPVLQFNPLPITIDPDAYEKPLTDSNPGGSYLTLFRFSQLVDPVPAFSRYYSQSGKSTEEYYGKILNGMAVKEGNTFVARLKAEAQQKFEGSVFVNMGGIPGNWRPTYAVPDDWYDTSQIDRYKDLEFDLSDEGERDGPFTLIGSERPMQLSLGEDRGSSASLDPGTRIRSVKMKYLLVQFRRPWLNTLLFESEGWYLSGQPQGWCSSGKTDENSGVLPLLSTGMLLARDISIDAEWSARDQAFLDSARSSEKPVFLGPLSLTPPRSSSSLQIIGWISSLVPYSPRASDLRPGSILIRNQGAFVSRFSVQWQRSGRPATEESGNFPVLAAKSIRIPPDATNVSVKIEIMTFPEPFETWKTVAVYPFDKPVTKCYEITGETWNANLREIPCAE
jgi:hypothetical protein